MELSPYYTVVEAALQKNGVDPVAVRGAKPGQWSIWREHINVMVDVWFIEREGRPYFQVMAPMLSLKNAHTPSLYREVLEANDRLYGVSFTIYQDILWLKTIRECEGLDIEEAFAAILRVGAYGLEYEPYFKQKIQPK